jgi:hypothetical protein
MADTRTLTDHEAIREWAAARMGAPAMRPAEPAIGIDEPVLTLLFDQQAYEDQDRGADRPPTMGDLEMVEWDDWFEVFDRHRLALVVNEDRDGVRENFYEIVVR